MGRVCVAGTIRTGRTVQVGDGKNTCGSFMGLFLILILLVSGIIQLARSLALRVRSQSFVFSFVRSLSFV